MDLIGISILNYKSIKKAIYLEMPKEKGVITFIGKNGSGKTNLLQAIKRILLKSDYLGEKSPIEGKYVLSISEKEKQEYFSAIDFNKISDKIEVSFSAKEPNVKKVVVPPIKIVVKKYKEKLTKIIKELKKASRSYIEDLQKIEMSYSKRQLIGLKVSDKNGSISYIDKNRIEDVCDRVEKQIKEINKFLNENFEKDNIIFEEHKVYYDSPYLTPIQFYQIEEEDISFSPIIADILKLDAAGIEEINRKLRQEIHKINSLLNQDYEKIRKCLASFEEIQQEMKRLFFEKEEQYYEQAEEIEEKYNKFCLSVKDAIFRTGYFIDNETSLLFYQQDSFSVSRRIDFIYERNPIILAIHNFLNNSNLYKQNESVLEINKISLTRLKILEKAVNDVFLKSLVANFDKREINGFETEFTDKGINLFVLEKTGERVDFNLTSLGRRWYLTYSFIKNVIKSGEVLFIDEPAAFLHPEAQIEFREDLENLTQKGVLVFITTHSPYMIPDNWNYVFNVNMTSQGTQLLSFKDETDLCQTINTELGISRTNDILFNLSKTILFVEGISDETCIKKFASKLGYDLSDYYVFTCHGSSILALAYLCIKQNIKFKALLDRDNKNKNEEWLNYHRGYDEYIKIVTENENCVFTPEKGKEGSLEDCFAEEDKRRYFYEKAYSNGNKKMKIGYREVEDGEVFTLETLNNFDNILSDLKIPKMK